MTALEINDVKGFMAKLLASDTFDNYYLLEAVITKANTFSIDGRLNEEYLADMEESSGDSGASAGSRFQTWGNVRSICYELVKGKTLPVYMKVVLQLSDADTERLLSDTGVALRLEDVTGLYLNLTYDRKELRCVTGTSFKTFTMDKSLEREWDTHAERLLKEFTV